MRFLSHLLIAVWLAPSFLTAGPGDEANPFFAPFNETANLAAINAPTIKSSSEEIVKRSRAALEQIYAVKAEERTFQNTMLRLDDAINELHKVMYLVYLIGNTHPDDATRDQANASMSDLNKFENELQLDENLFQAVKEYSKTKEAAGLSGYKKKFLTETVRDFERNGFALPKDQRDSLKVLLDKLGDLGIAFNQNIAAVSDFLVVTEQDMEGMPEDYKSGRRQEDGTYKIDLSYPSYSAFMKSATSGSARKALWMKYNNRAADVNLDVLSEILRYRQKTSRLLGYNTYGEYRVADRMAKTTQAVWDFENRLMEKVKAKAKVDYDELLEAKRAYLKDAKVKTIDPWEASFYNNILLQQKYQVDQEKVKEYFELNNVIDGLFRISQHLFDVQFEEIADPSVWHEDVRAFAVRQDGRLIGRFYLDLYPRANKYSHAACFAMIRGKQMESGYQMPVATLVCNFPQPTADRPALMYHALGSSSVETFFHEFGHVLHNLLTTSELYSFAGTQVARDFVEAPSQIFENWAWNYDALKLFAKHYKTGEVLPKEMFDRMLAARNVGSGIAASYQIFYGVLDMTLHDRFDPNGTKTTTDVVKEVQNRITPYPYVEGTHMQAAFGHLEGYGASYYGYLWSKVYSADMFSVFDKNGILDKNTGRRYREIILARGATQEPLELVKEFLGREPNEEAFLKALGL